MIVVFQMAAVAAERSTHDIVYAAVIAALAAIVGGIIGGSIPGYFMLKAEDKRQAHAREIADKAREDEIERERRAVIGTARAMYEFFDRVGMMFGVALQTDYWWSDEIDVTLQPPSLDDQNAVLRQLTSSEAGVVTTTVRVIELLRATRDITSELGPEGPTLGEVARAQLTDGRTAAQQAASSLRRVAELPTPSTTSDS
ncbi:MAG: hypothetical protein QOE69_1068 [Thermoleophilaceae bacterium]|jgi:hypothetical protein|nr:hypothetical protein [Thermoleophilaceae bacterium]